MKNVYLQQNNLNLWKLEQKMSKLLMTFIRTLKGHMIVLVLRNRRQ